MPNPFQPIQITTMNISSGPVSVDKLVALCANGTIWELVTDTIIHPDKSAEDVQRWQRLPLIGVDERKEKEALQIQVEAGILSDEDRHRMRGERELELDSKVELGLMSQEVADLLKEERPTDPNAGDYHI